MKIRFPAKWSRYYPADYEKENYTILQQFIKPGMDIIDIGAHIGLFSTCCSQLNAGKGKIISFEPTPGTYALLNETLSINKCENVISVQAAVSEKEGIATFYISHTAGCNSNSLVKNREEKDLSAYDVKLVTIDSIITTYSLKPSLVKIDAEGAELDVLKGGVKTFKEFKPALILGLHPAFIRQKGDSLEDIWDLMTNLQYKMELDGKEMSREDFCGRDLLFDVHCFSK